MAFQTGWGAETISPVNDFGVVEDGETNNDETLESMRDYMREDTSKLYNIRFNGGTVLYTDNRWLAHIGAARLLGNGVTLHNTVTTTVERRSRPFNNSTPFYDAGDAINGGTLLQGAPGDRFKSVAAGASAIEFYEADKAAGYTVGERLLLAGFDQQFAGFPPNFRYFDYVAVRSVNESANTIGVSPALTHAYDEAWPQINASAPAEPRAWKLEKLPVTATTGYLQPRYIELRDMRIKYNENGPESHANGLVLSADHLKMVNVHHEGYVWPSINALYEAYDCSFWNTDIDKLVSVCIFDGCSFNSHLSAATGVERLTIRSCSIAKRVRAEPRAMEIANTVILGDTGENYGVIQAAEGWPCHSSSIENSELVGHGSLLHYINNIPVREFSTSHAGTDCLVLEDTTEGNTRLTIAELDVGYRLFRQSPSEECTVNRISFDGVNDRWLIYVDGLATPQIGAEEDFRYYTVQTLRYRKGIERQSVPTIRYERPSQLDVEESTTFQHEDSGP